MPKQATTNGSSILKEYARGFKQITLENLLKPDDHPSYPSRLRGDKWVLACLKPLLDPSVPVEVAFLFEAARGSLVYGMYFLPLAALATEQGFRVLEAGARHRCKQPFMDLVAALQKAGKIPEGDMDAWKAMVYLRNRSSHPTAQDIRPRDKGIEQLAYIAELLNRLFK
jgi:hypothetical protein